MSGFHLYFLQTDVELLARSQNLFHLVEMDSYEDFISVALISVCEEK